MFFFLSFALKHEFWVLTYTENLCFEHKFKKDGTFLLKIIVIFTAIQIRSIV